MNKEKKQILESIKQGYMLSFDGITLKDLLQVDKNGISYLEYACKNKDPFLWIGEEIQNNLEAMYICAKNNYLNWIISIDNENIFFEKTKDGDTLIEYIFKNNVEVKSYFLYNFKKNYEIIDYLLKYKKSELRNLSSDIINVLLTKQNGIYPIDKYIEIPEIKEKLVLADNNLLINYCIEKNRYDILKNANEELLLTDIGNGQKLIEKLFEMGIDPTFYGYDFKSKEIVEILIKNNKIDLLYNANILLLLSNYNDNKTYFDLMIDKQREGKDVHLEKLSYKYKIYPANVTAIELLKLAQNNLQGFVPNITKEMLMYRGENDKRSVIECLIDMDKDLTISRIIPKCQGQSSPDFVIVLRNLGIEDTRITHKNENNNLVFNHIEQFNENYAKDCISTSPELLSELKELFYNDGKSDKSIIDTLIISYQYLTSTNHPNCNVFASELKQLIEIKKHNYDKFTYTKTDSGAHFNRNTGGIFMPDNDICTLNHETSHALHYYLANYCIPDEYGRIIENAKNNPELINKVNDYSKKYRELRKKIKSEIPKNDIINHYESLYQGDKLLELALFLGSTKDEQKEKFKKDYNEQVLDTILANTYTTEEYIKEIIELEIAKITIATINNQYTGLAEIGDIIDAIYNGKFLNGALFNKEGSDIKPTAGHGIDYYQLDLDRGFIEMIAEYGAIIKSKNSENMLTYLRSIVGDEIVDMIKNVYEQNILNSQVYMNDLETEEISHAR